MSRGPNTPYYDDEYMQGIEDYTVVDYTQPTAADYNSPNTDKSVAIVDQSPKYHIEETSIYVEERLGPVYLGRDQQLEILNLIEAGEIISIELVTDNPYIGLYIEMDDFKYKTPNGMTAAELLLKGRDEYAERHFYAEDRRADGSYVVKFHPRTDRDYHDRLKITVRNDITRPQQVRGALYTYSSRASLPTPSRIGFNGGSFAHVPGNSAILASDKLQILTPIVARGIDVDFTDSVIRNDQVRTSPLTLIGASNPYVGNMGKINHVAIVPDAVTDARAVWGEPGVGISSTTGASDDLLTTPYPGSVKADGTTAASSQQLIIYGSNAETESTTGTGLQLMIDAIFSAKENGDTFFFSKDDTVYYPGKIHSLKYYDSGTSAFVEMSQGAYQPTDGAILLTLSPGFDFIPPKADILDDGYDAIGTLEKASLKHEAIIHEVIVKRKKKKTLS